MLRSIKLMSFPMLVTLSLAAGSVAAEPPGAPSKAMTKEQTTAGEQLQNAGEETQHQNQNQNQNRHRFNEQNPEHAKKVRSEQQQDSEQQQSGSQMGGFGGGGGGGGGRGR